MSSTAFLEAIRHVTRNTTEPFAHWVRMTVYYNNNAMVNGREYKSTNIDTPPMVIIGGDINELYTSLLVVPDAPNPSEPTSKEVVSWIVTNIPGGTWCDQGMEFLLYHAPDPEIGVHRGIFALYNQQSMLDGIDTIGPRDSFNTRAFAYKHSLKPVGMAYSTSGRKLKRGRL